MRTRRKIAFLLRFYKINVLTGSSGVGKSSIINCLFKKNVARVQRVAAKANWGKQTTRINLFYIWRNRFIADTPGFSSLMLQKISTDQLARLFLELLKLKPQCYFKNCYHKTEQKCLIKSLVATGKIPQFFYQNYLSILQEIQTYHARK